MRVCGRCHYELHLRIESIPFAVFRTQTALFTHSIRAFYLFFLFILFLFYFVIPTSQPSQCQSYQAHSGVRANMMDVVTDLGHIKVHSASARDTRHFVSMITCVTVGSERAGHSKISLILPRDPTFSVGGSIHLSLNRCGASERGRERGRRK